MLALMNELTDDPEWAQLIHTTTFIQEWKENALAQHAGLTSLMADWVCSLRVMLCQNF